MGESQIPGGPSVEEVKSVGVVETEKGWRGREMDSESRVILSRFRLLYTSGWERYGRESK